MGVATCMLIALAHIYVANGSSLSKPIALSILSKDLQSLEVAFPTKDLWPDMKIIKYDDELQIAVNYDQHAARSYNGQSFLMITGRVTLAKMKKLPKGLFEMVPAREVRKLLFQNTWFYFETPESDPLLNVDDYYITDYQPLIEKRPLKPTIEYIPGNELESELMEFVQRIRYESSLTGAKLMKTSFHLKNTIKLDVQYDQGNDFAVFSADYQVLVLTDKRNLIKESVKLDKLSFFLYKQSSPELAQLGLIYGVRVAPPASQPSHAVGNLLKIKRDILLKDLLDARPVQTTDAIKTVGIIKYDSARIYTANHISINQKNVLSLNGSYVANDGTAFKGLCLAFPGGQTDIKDLKRFKNSDVFSENPVFFSCPVDDTPGHVQILLQEDSDYIELDGVPPRAIEAAAKSFFVEPYLEYISYEKFLQTMLIVTDHMKLRCANGYPRQSFRLFVNVFLNFDCSPGKAYFDSLDMWLGPGKGQSFLWENLPGLSYDSNTKCFSHGGSVLANFKVRQLYPATPDKVPLERLYTTSNGQRNLAFELSSVEWDLQETRKNLLKNFLPQWGVIHVDNFVLFVAEKSKESIEGEKVTTIVIKCDVTEPESCNDKQCANKKEIVYDGNRITMRNSEGVESDKVPTKVYWPNTFMLPILNDMFSVSYKIRYVKLPTFKKHMRELVGKLAQYCSALKKKTPTDAKFTLHLQYFNNKESTVIAYYHCALNYISFFSDFKVIKFANIRGVSTSYRPGEESTLGVQPGSPFSSLPPVPYPVDVNVNQNIDRIKPVFESEEGQLRRKYSSYIIQDLLYDPAENILHSKSMFMSDVYALRPLHTNVQESSQKGNHLHIRVNGGPEVHVYNV